MLASNRHAVGVKYKSTAKLVAVDIFMWGRKT